MIKFFILLLLFLSCSTPQQKFENFVSAGQCSEAIDYIKGSYRRNILNHLQSSVGNTSSYILSGLGYGADLIVVVTGGTVVGTALCAPIIAFEVSANGSGQVSAECISLALRLMSNSDVKYSSIGDKTYKSTISWRCPAKGYFLDNILDVTECYINSGEPANKIKARKQIDTIHGNRIFSSCMSNNQNLRLKELEKALSY
jgi:hypothetical protein